MVDVLPWGGMGGRDTKCKAPLIIQMLKGATEVNKLLLLIIYLTALLGTSTSSK